MMNALLILLSMAVIIAVYYYSVFNYWQKRGVKTLTPNLLFGNLTDVILGKTALYGMFKEVYKTCKKRGDKFMGFYFLNKPTMVITDIELVKLILAKDFAYFTDRPFYLDEKNPLTFHIGSAKGNQWKKMREQLSPAFSPSKMKNMFHSLLQIGDHLKSALDKSIENCEIVNMIDVSGKYITDAIGMSAFGIECNNLQNLNMEFKKIAEYTTGGSLAQNIKFTLSMLCPSVLQFFRIPLNSLEVLNFYLNMVKSIVEYREKNNVVRNDLMHLIIQSRNNIDTKKENDLNLGNVSENERSLTIEEISAQAMVFFGAAYGTSSSTISLCIYELASNLDVLDNLRKEIFSVLGKYGGKFSFESIMEMTYLDKCISETCRKYAMVGMLPRICTKMYNLPNTDIVLDVGTTVYIPVYEIHHDSKYYPNPEKFDPERFSPENKSNRPGFTYLAFGEGPLNCIGGRLGLLVVKIFLVIFVSNYNFIINQKVKLPPTLSKSSFVVSLQNPLYLDLAKI